MACKFPLTAWRQKGTKQLTFKEESGIGAPLQIPCGHCLGCKLEYSRQWAIRCLHEATLHEQNCFITLTYNDEYLPNDHSLHIEHFQKFMKRYRKKYGKIRFYHSGEYGSKFGRPHYHAAIFGHCFDDLKLYKRTKIGNSLFISAKLTELWPFGYSTVAELNFQTAAYIARYVVKKINGTLAENSEHYEYIDYTTGEVFTRKPEYSTMSRRPGIAAGWYDKYHTDVYPSDQVIIKGKPVMPPRYYDYMFECSDPIGFQNLKLKREEKRIILPNKTQLDLIREHDCLIEKNKLLIRNLENEI